MDAVRCDRRGLVHDADNFPFAQMRPTDKYFFSEQNSRYVLYGNRWMWLQQDDHTVITARLIEHSGAGEFQGTLEILRFQKFF